MFAPVLTENDYTRIAELVYKHSRILFFLGSNI